MIIHADILKWAETYDGPPFHALLADPPYHLTEIVKRFGKEGAAPAKGDVYARSARGFMGRVWDGGSVAFEPETWAALAQHLYPGAFGMAFSGSRGWHRMAVAIEDAGLIIHPTIFCWAYGSGFPKATRIDTQVDRQAGAERRTVGTKKHQPKFAAAELGYREKDNGYNSKSRESFDVTAPATDLAQAWQGHRYGMQAMKPAIEPIIVFQKPYTGRPVDSITATGAGALNVNGGRIGTEKVKTNAKGALASPQAHLGPTGYTGCNESELRDGRWPPNFCLVHHPACNGACHPDCVVRRLGEQSGESESTDRPRNNGEFESVAKGRDLPHVTYGHSDSGTAARFFHQSDWMAERLEEADIAKHYKCLICGCKEQKRGIMNEKQYTTEDICDLATNAENSLSQPNEPADSAPIHAQHAQPLASAGKSENRPIPATSAENSLKSSPETSESIAPLNAPNSQVAQIARDARFVANLCDSCAIGIARSLVATLQGSDPESPLGAASMPARKKQILLHSLALFAASRVSNDTTLTIADLSTFFGFVSLAIENNTPAKTPPPVPQVLYVSKASRGEREAGLDPRQIALMRTEEEFNEATINDGRQKSIDNPYQRGETTRRNVHPTIKPLSLCKWLATLLLPPAMYAPRRILIPFAGVASEMIGARLAGWEEVVGVELEESHIAIAKARLAYWEQMKYKITEASTDVNVKISNKADDGQLEMF